MFSKAKMGMLLGTMAAVLSIGSFGSAFAADNNTQANHVNKPAHVKMMGGKMEHRGGFGFGIGFDKNDELLSLLNLNADQLKEAVKSGKSLADVAKDQGVSEDDVIALLVKQQAAKLADAVKAGKLTQEQADKMSQNAADRVKEQVENTRHEGKGRGEGREFGFGKEKNNELLSLLKLDADKLQEAMKAGKSLADVAKDQGVSEDDVIALLTKQQKDKLAEAVKAGKLTQEQADKRNEKASEHIKQMVENTHQGKGFERGGFGFGFDKNDELLSLLKLDADQLKEAVKSGKSLADVAKDQGVTEEDLVALLVKQQQAKLDEAVKAGKLTQEQADKMNTNASERIKAMVENAHQGKEHGKGFGFRFDKNDELLSLLKLDADQLKEAVKSGKSLADVAKDQGVSEDDVIALLVKQHKDKLKAAVDAGKITQEQADKQSGSIQSFVKKFVEGNFEKVAFPGKDEDQDEQ